MKLLLRLIFLYIPGFLLATTFLLSAFIWQQELVSRRDLQDLAELARSQGIQSVISVIRVEMFGAADMATDHRYGRRAIDGRGHSPWVVRGNLDGRPRMLSFALTADIWAAYDTQTASLYQVWQGDILWQGAAYDYRHGPQPEARGAWFLRREKPVQWYLQSADSGVISTAQVSYLGHEYGPGQNTAGLRFEVRSAGQSLEITEYPEIVTRDGKQFLQRDFRQSVPVTQLQASFSYGAEPAIAAVGSVNLALSETTTISNETFERQRATASNELEGGRLVVANSDCLSCHNPEHEVVGPSWGRIAGRYRGHIQDEPVIALARSIREGSTGKWSSLVMPPQRDLSEQDARNAAIFILDHPEVEATNVGPRRPDGTAYVASSGFDIYPAPATVHPAFRLENLLPAGFEPKVGGMDFRPDGKILVASWDQDGSIFLIDLAAAEGIKVTRIAEGLQEPLGLKVVGKRLFVLQKQELTELVDNDGDELIDEYRSFAASWPTSANFHSFAFGLAHRDNALYALLSVCVLPGGASCPEQLPTQGKLLRISLTDGSVKVVASGFRTPNGIGLGPNDTLFVSDNQGDWLPANKLVEVREGGFYGSRAVPDAGILEAQEFPPVVWLPQHEIGNSPTQPLLMTEGPYAGQMIHGDVANGGIKRVFLENIGGAYQGAAFQFSDGFQAGVNRMVRGPDGNIYLGEIGNPPNWSVHGKAWHGLEKLIYTGNSVFEILSVEAELDGFTFTFTEPLAGNITLQGDDLLVKQWFYHPTEQYGGPKYDEKMPGVEALELSDDRRRLHARIPGLEPGRVVYLRLDRRLRSENGNSLWAAEAWYTLNRIPEDVLADDAPVQHGKKPQPSEKSVLFDGSNFGGWRNYGGQEGAVEKWVIEDGTLALQPGKFGFLQMVKNYIFGGVTGDLVYGREKFRNFELSLEWKIAENGNSGIFYLVADEAETTPWKTGLEMQVLHNEGHPDGKITTHRAGDLYDLVAADPETVKSPGEWNHAIIRVQNNQIEHWLNGVKVLSIKRGSERWQAAIAASKFADWARFGIAEEGYIALQDHGDPVWYRNITIRRLD